MPAEVLDRGLGGRAVSYDQGGCLLGERVLPVSRRPLLGKTALPASHRLLLGSS